MVLLGGNWVKGKGPLISVIIVNLQLSQNTFGRKMRLDGAVQVMLRVGILKKDDVKEPLTAS